MLKRPFANRQNQVRQYRSNETWSQRVRAYQYWTKLGLPISTTHTLVGAVLGVGLARGIEAVNMGTIRDVFISWVITIPAGAVLAILFFYCLRLFF